MTDPDPDPDPDPIPVTIHLDAEVLGRAMQRWAAKDLRGNRTWRQRIRAALRELRG